MSAAPSIVAASLAALTALPGAYLLTLAIAAHFHHPAATIQGADLRVAILVPAHNEAELLGRCLASLATQTYPAARRRLLVIADNCTDATAMVAVCGGAGVMLRDDPSHPGKGQALRWAFDRLLAKLDPPDAFVIVDADSVADPGLVAGLVDAVHRGAEAAQAEYLVLDDPTDPAAGLRQAAFLLFHRTRFAGRAALGLPCSLVGNGMLLTSGLLRRIPWMAFTGTEDMEYSTNLRLAGVRPWFAPTALVSGPASGLGRAAATQRRRWEGGHLHVLRTHLLPLLAGILRGNRWLVDAAVDLATPSLGLLTLLTLAGGAVVLAAGLAGVVGLWAGLPWAGAALLLIAYLVIGLHAARAPASAYRGLLRTPQFLGAKLITYAHLAKGTHAERWERSERPGDRVRVTVSGLPIDALTKSEAAEQIVQAAGVGGKICRQVSTVNLQFLVSAHRQSQVRESLRSSWLNLADGAPVLWLSRILGHRLPGRVTGVDLVDAVAARAAVGHVPILLFGGHDGVAEQAATELRRRHPGLRASVYEPPVIVGGEPAEQDAVQHINGAGAGVVLVALGHPKQELFITANRDRLRVPVAIGVGGSFDILTGRFRRAPKWAQRSGLEWVFRLLQEPRRLFARYATGGLWLAAVLLPQAVWQRLTGAPVIAGAEPDVHMVMRPSPPGWFGPPVAPEGHIAPPFCGIVPSGLRGSGAGGHLNLLRGGKA